MLSTHSGTMPETFQEPSGIPPELNSLLSRLSPEAKLEYARKRAEYIVAQRSAMDHTLTASEWIQRYFYVPELKGPLWLAPYQRAVLDEATSIDPATGLFKYSTIVWGDIKKSIKSCVAAGMLFWMTYRTPWASGYSVANDLKQSNSRVGYYMRRAVILNPAMKLTAKVENYRIDIKATHSFVESVPIDPTGEAGSNADIVVFSELHGAHEEAKTRMWTEMTLPPNKFGKSLRWVETYAGYSGESLLLEQLYLTAQERGIPVIFEDENCRGLQCWSVPEARMLVMWNTTPRLPWQTPEYYAQEEAVLPPNEFLRVHRNQWVSSTAKFVPEEWWAQCHWSQHNDLTAFPQMRERQPVIFALDAGVSNDHFGLVGVFRVKDRVVTFYVNEWVPTAHKKLDFSVVEKEVRRLAKAYNVVEFAYDEFQLHDMTTRLRREGVGYFRPFPQGAGSPSKPGRPAADKQLYDMIQQRRVIHDGNPILTAHINNANASIEGSSRERLLIVKRSPLLKIDTCVALSMATAEALRLNLT